MVLMIRKLVIYQEEIRIEGGKAANRPVNMVLVAAVAQNPWANRGFVDDLSPEIGAYASELGALLVERLTATIAADRIVAYGKAAVVGANGEVEHASALIHTLRFGNHYRTAVNAKSYLSFTNKRGGLGTSIQVPMMHKDDEGQRSHYITGEFAISDAPLADEIVVVLGAADGGRVHPRIGNRYLDLEAIAAENAARGSIMDDNGEDGTIDAAYDDSGGDLPAVVLIHGVGLSRGMWSAQVEALRDRYRVVTLDMLGHGASPRPDRGATLDNYADHVSALMTRAGIDRAALVGFSMGALVARAFALRHPSRLTGLAFLNGVFARTPQLRASILERVDEVAAKGPMANIDAAIGRWFSPDFRASRPGYLQRLRGAFANNDPQGYETSYRLFATQDAFGSDRLGTIACPVLVATGELDVGSTPAMAHALAARIPGATLRIVAGARHMMPVEMPDAVSALLLDFLGSLRADENDVGEHA